MSLDAIYEEIISGTNIVGTNLGSIVGLVLKLASTLFLSFARVIPSSIEGPDSYDTILKSLRDRFQ